MAIQHTCNLLEYSMVSGIDCLDVLMTIKSGLVEPIYELFTESFLRQPPAFQQYYYHNWLKIRIALCRLTSPLSTSASWLSVVQMCHYAWSAALPALRPDDRPEHNLILSLDDGDTDKTLLALEAKPECLGDVSSLQPLIRQLQRALDVAVTALLSLQHSTHQSHGYELWSDPTAVIVLRKLVVLARASGRGGDALSRPLARLHGSSSKHELQEECASLWGQSVNGARSWEGAPRCSITAPHNRPHPLYLEYGVEPENLKFMPEAPSYLQADVPPPRQMDTIRYMYLGGGGLPAKCKQCGRCGALAAHHSTHHHRHALLVAADARLMHRCRCGGKWTLVSNV
ncbi:hypothetical protein evm_012875 [Chilo suppressalis]|nr:hypothetical protein evm_012875 [Chilo suppressalis]